MLSMGHNRENQCQKIGAEKALQEISVGSMESTEQSQDKDGMAGLSPELIDHWIIEAVKHEVVNTLFCRAGIRRLEVACLPSH